MFYQEAYVAIDCETQPTVYFEKKPGYCAFELTKSFGWYADLDLEFVVKGYVLR